MPRSDSETPTRALLQQGMQAARKGDRARASALFQAVVEQDPDQEEAWLWLAALAESPQQSVVYLQRVLAINPHNTRAQAGLQWARERIQAVEALPEAPMRPAWGGIVNLAPLEPEGTRWKWWHVVGLTTVLLLAGALVWWGTPRIFEFVEVARPEATPTESMATASSSPTGTPLSPTEAVIATDLRSPLPPTASTIPTGTSSPLPPMPTAIPTATSSALPPTATPSLTPTSSPLPPTATAIPTPTSSPLPRTAVPTPATVWPTPGPTSAPLITPRATPPSPR